eukprot:scaffold8233_cov101-Isochrysis_galbana.AAC.3
MHRLHRWFSGGPVAGPCDRLNLLGDVPAPRRQGAAPVAARGGRQRRSGGLEVAAVVRDAKTEGAAAGRSVPVRCQPHAHHPRPEDGHRGRSGVFARGGRLILTGQAAAMLAAAWLLADVPHLPSAVDRSDPAADGGHGRVGGDHRADRDADADRRRDYTQDCEPGRRHRRSCDRRLRSRGRRRPCLVSRPPARRRHHGGAEHPPSHRERHVPEFVKGVGRVVVS